MFDMLGITPQALYSQLLVGLINGSFYAVLSLGLAVIFGMLNIINFSHGAQYMMGAFLAWIGLTQLAEWTGIESLQVSYWMALVLAPLIVGVGGTFLTLWILSLVVDGLKKLFPISAEEIDVKKKS